MRVNKGAGNEREINIYTKLILEMCLLKSVLDKYSVSEILLPTLPVLNKAKKEILRTKMYSNVHIVFFYRFELYIHSSGSRVRESDNVLVSLMPTWQQPSGDIGPLGILHFSTSISHLP